MRQLRDRLRVAGGEAVWNGAQALVATSTDVFAYDVNRGAWSPATSLVPEDGSPKALVRRAGGDAPDDQKRPTERRRFGGVTGDGSSDPVAGQQGSDGNGRGDEQLIG